LVLPRASTRPFLDDGAHTVFGRVIEDSSGFLERVTALPTNNLERPKAVYNAQ
jgi:hypothetical protein